jgi:hypothetical protein
MITDARLLNVPRHAAMEFSHTTGLIVNLGVFGSWSITDRVFPPYTLRFKLSQLTVLICHDILQPLIGI